MDPLSMTASITALVTVAAQIRAAIKQMHAFWSSVADAPASLLGLLADIELVRDLFDGIDASMARHVLESLARTVLPGATDNPTKIVWKSAKAVLKADKLQPYKAHLESTKLSLVLAHGYASHSLAQNLALSIQKNVTSTIEGALRAGKTEKGKENSHPGAAATVEKEVVIIPRRWITASAVRFLVKWEISSRGWSLCQFRSRSHMVVPDDAAVLKACYVLPSSPPHLSLLLQAEPALKHIFYICGSSEDGEGGCPPSDEEVKRVAKMLVERGSEIDDIDEVVFSLFVRGGVEVSSGATLDYLCRSEAMAWDWATLRPKGLQDIWTWESPLALAIRKYVIAGLKMDRLDREVAKNVMCMRLLSSLNEELHDAYCIEYHQSYGFNGRVIEFGILLRNGWDPRPDIGDVCDGGVQTVGDCGHDGGSSDV
ncbi:hypothetical protein B0T24DRAFT_702413 [Lasiosphaeria ovina]|uniref:NACHT-NTPase and P-loop NTPases N-terminal domain-containing protein n=1 Tax=Lasiosphaeria ovina TaxID=92902 RepID=A0AAE0KB88_9PEZI|nr:hypothetical protein B0T24DRAFT_702413 [Lasiosphaeria ovina]